MLHLKNTPFRLSAVLLAAALGMTTTACSDDDKDEDPDVTADVGDAGMDPDGMDPDGMDPDGMDPDTSTDP